MQKNTLVLTSIKSPNFVVLYDAVKGSQHTIMRAEDKNVGQKTILPPKKF